MRLILVLALSGAVASAAFRPEDVARFREKNEEKIKQAILETEAAVASNSSTSSEEGGNRSELAGMKRDPDDSIQKAAAAHAKERDAEEAQRKLEASLEQELKQGVKEGLLLGGKDHGVAAPFDYLMFTMIYPTATCMADDDQVPDSCEIPTGTAQWTIHGLWPNFKDGSYPQFCDHQKFDGKQVEAIHEQMRTKWPNLFPKTPEAQLWSHEWEKHGTCSKTDPLLDSQFKYFNMSLFLLDHIDLRTRMEQKGISPRTAPYERDTLQKSLDELMGHHVQMYCLLDKKTHESLLADIRVCMNAELKPIDCPKTEIHPYVRAGTVTPDDHQPLPVPRKCSESVYYVPAGADISRSIDVLPPGSNETQSTGKKLDTEEDYYDDDDEEEGKRRDKEENERALKLEAELMEGLKLKTEVYQENLRKNHAAYEAMRQEIHKLQLPKEDEKGPRAFSRVTEMMKQFQASRVRGELPTLADGEEETRSVPLWMWLCMGVLVVYIIVVVSTLLGARSSRQPYGRLQERA